MVPFAEDSARCQNGSEMIEEAVTPESEIVQQKRRKTPARCAFRFAANALRKPEKLRQPCRME
jgi:hypothetical protein